MKKHNTANEAVDIVEKFLRRDYPNADIKRVDSGKKSEQSKGCDILVTEKGITSKIEVKGTKRKKKGISIPEAFQTQFNKSKEIVADFLYIVKFLKKEKKVYKIPKSIIDKYSDNHTIVKHIKFASALKTEINKNEKKYLINYK